MKRLSKFYGILLLVNLSLNLAAQESGKSVTETDTTIIDLNRPYYGNVKPPKFSGAEHGLQGYIMDKFRGILLHAPKHIPGTRDGKPARFKTKLIQNFEAHRGR